MDDETVIDLLTQHGWNVVEEYLGEHSAVEACRIGMMVLRDHQIHSYPVACRAGVYNDEAWDLLKQGRQAEIPMDENDGFSVGVGLGKRPSGFDHHLVLVVEDRYLLDLTIPQASHPDQGIDLHPFTLDIGSRPKDSEQLTVEFSESEEIDCEGFVLYEFQTTEKGYKKAPGYNRDDQNRALADRIHTRMEENHDQA